MYTKTIILQSAKKQLALDYNCQLSDFEKENIHHYYLPNPNVISIKPISTLRWYGHEDSNVH